MTFVSYAQNYEDVMLWRALRQVGHGFYIDVGANDPCIDSVTKAFYDRGWHGINVEPLLQHWFDLKRERPNDINLQCVVGEFCGETNFWEPEIPGWASADPDTIAMHQKQNVQGIWHKTPVLTLAEICKRHVRSEIHFLKIDVEGYEHPVISGMDFSGTRPWVVVVEATLPNSNTEKHQEWETILLSNAYILVYADGLNRFYLAKEKETLKEHFRYPPNVFDGFILYRQVKAEARLHELEQAIEAAEAQLHAKEHAIHHALVQAEALRTSTSWRLTRPLRGLARLLCGLKCLLHGDPLSLFIVRGAIRRRLSEFTRVVRGTSNTWPDLSPWAEQINSTLKFAQKQDSRKL